MAAEKKAPASFARRDHLLSVEVAVQQQWEASGAFTAAATPAGTAGVPKFMATFPYPYMNGRLHLGHAFTITKAEFASAYKRLRGANVLFPFAFHCTGMPIQAAANKLRRELSEGVHEAVLARLASGAMEEGAEEVGSEGAAVEAAAPAGAAPAAAPAAAAEGAPAAEKTLGKFTGKKTKAAAKSGGAVMTQFEILLKSGIAAADIPAFREPEHWLRFFPPLGEADLRKFGLGTDWRRSFITTSANPFYDSFIRWQFNTLRARDKLGFGKRPTIYSVVDGQACADHDRSQGEGVQPQEYTLVKLSLKEVPPAHPAAARLAPLAALLGAGRPVFLVAATLRPETMYGQTNCYLLPDGEYGAFEVGPQCGVGEVFICSERSARNMCYQGLSAARGAVSCVGTFQGAELLGLPLAAPLSVYPTVYTLPLLTISMKKGTGVVTSVPSDSPDDWAAYRDLQKKPALREKYGLTEAMCALPVVEIIDIPGYGRTAALAVCDQLKIQSQNDKEKLKEAKELVYQTGFYQGVMVVGPHAGKKVCEAKALVRAELLACGAAAPYWEPESLVVSRSGDECVVAELDQWYLKYGEEEWRGAVSAWVNSPNFKTFNPANLDAFNLTLSWLREWACSRSFGLGTRLPWDTQFVIESLSDSTIYMAYYTFAHLLHPGSLDGSTRGPGGLEPGDLTDAAWDYVLLGRGEGAPEGGALRAALEPLRREFVYWYPMDLRVSGKDLIQNHLTMSLYNHAAVWGAAPDRMPGGFFCNGHVLVDGEKMSKSKGNFIMLHEAISRWGADATRFALADAGDSLEDANFESSTADTAILRLTTEEEWFGEMAQARAAGKLREGEFSYADRVFEARVIKCVHDAEAAYEGMRFRDALKASFFEMLLARDAYRDMCEKMEAPMHGPLVGGFIGALACLLAPVCPHFSRHVWGGMLARGAEPLAWPAAFAAKRPDPALLKADAYLSGKLHEFRLALLKASVGKPGKAGKAGAPPPAPRPTAATIVVAGGWPDWQRRPLQQLQGLWGPGGFTVADPLAEVKAAAMADAALKPFFKKLMPLAANAIAEQKEWTGEGLCPSLSLEAPFDEFGVWTDNAEYVRKALNLPEGVTVLRTGDAAFAEALAAAVARDVSGKNLLEVVVPLAPAIVPA